MADQAELLFYNETMDRTAVRQLINKLTIHFGIAFATNLLDQIKILGFRQATKASVSSGIDDLSTVPSKGWLVQDAERQGSTTDRYHLYGSLHAVEKLRQSIEAWYATSECLKREMNPSFQMIDPINSVHMMSFSGARGSISQVHQLLGMRGLMSDPRGQVIDLPIRRNLREGLSLTEYIISCYGARKGVVDTAVRTSDAGYLTRRPVEVVQHIVVRKKDCGTIKGIALNVVEGRKESIRTVSQQRSIGRVLADNVYSSERCVAVRNQDTSDGLTGNLVSAIQPIYIRSPLICRTNYWICQFCYGWSPARHDLVELGEAVGIVAGQSIGEPGTQLTLRTFHTGGVFTGDIAEYVRTPFSGTVNFDEGSMSPTRTRHGHPAWICRNKLTIFIRGSNYTSSIVIPTRSLIMIRNDQYVESQQIIAEVRAREFPLKERIQKSIYPNLEGEIHRSGLVCHPHKRLNETIHVVRDTGHIWILSGNSNYFIENCFSHQDQDRIDGGCCFGVNKDNRNQGNRQFLDDVKCRQKRGTILKCFLENILPINTYSLINFVTDFGRGRDVPIPLARRGREYGSPSITGWDGEGIFVNSDNYEYRADALAITKCSTIRVESIDQVAYILIGDSSRTSSTRSQETRVIKGGNYFSIPEEWYVTDEPPLSICLTNSSFVGRGTQLTPSITSQASGSVQIEKTGGSTETRILIGYAYYPKKLIAGMDIPKGEDIILPPGDSIFDNLTFEDWVCFRLIAPKEGNILVLIRPVIRYNVSECSFLQTGSLFQIKMPESSKWAKIQPIMYENAKHMELSNERNGIQFVRTCLIVHQQRNLSQPFSKKWTYTFFHNAVTHDSLNTFLQIGLSRISFDLVATSGSSRLLGQPRRFESPVPAFPNQPNPDDRVIRHRSAIHLISRRDLSPLALSPLNLLRDIIYIDIRHNKTVGDSISNGEFKFTTGKRGVLEGDSHGNYHENNHFLGFDKKKSSDEEFTLCFSSIKNENLGLLGKSLGLSTYLLNSHFDFAPVASGSNYIVDYLTDTLEHKTWYSIDESKRVVKYLLQFLISDILVWNDTESIGLKLGILIGENQYFSDENICLKSGQVIAIQEKHFFIRRGKPYLINQGATIHRSGGDTIEERDTSITLPYDRSKSRDIIQGLPKVEQLLESRPIGSVPTRVVDVSERRSEGVIEPIGNFWSHFLSAGASMEHCQSVLIDQIRKVHESQGVQLVDKHIEIIIRQLTSKVIFSGDGVTNVFLPGEFIGSSQAQRLNRSSKRYVSYEPTVLGMTKASLNTTSFLSEASFQETTRVLAGAASQGRTDWPKGLKENATLGDVAPIGTGSQEIVNKKDVEKQQELLVLVSSNGIFEAIEGLFFNHGVDPSFRYEPPIWRKSKQTPRSDTNK
nr:RNA polymerase beta'' subunit [Actinostachys digitata]